MPHAGAVEAAEGLDGLDAIQFFIHVHGVEQGFVEACLIFVRHHQDAIFRRLVGIFNCDTRGQAVQAVLGVFLVCVGVGDFARERDQRLEGQVLLFHHFAEGQIELDGVQTRAGDDHRPAFALNGVHGLLQKVVEHDAGLLLDGVRGQVHVGGEQADGFLLFVFVVGRDGLDQLEVTLEGGVIPEHIQDEVLFDGLAHGIDMMGDELPVRIFDARIAQVSCSWAWR